MYDTCEFVARELTLFQILFRIDKLQDSFWPFSKKSFKAFLTSLSDTYVIIVNFKSNLSSQEQVKQCIKSADLIFKNDVRIVRSEQDSEMNSCQIFSSIPNEWLIVFPELWKVCFWLLDLLDN